MTADADAAGVKATIVIPTMKGRGPLLPVTVGTVLAQTVREIEVFLIGDGVDPDTRQVIRNLMAADTRIRFFDNPKHPSRGEPNRHEALQNARGRIVCYMCDRDLMLPNHVETMLGLLENADFAHTLISAMRPNGEIWFHTAIDLADPDDRKWILRGWRLENGIPLSCAGHTLDMYRRLPHGWCTTPEGLFTDVYMWEQFLAQPGCRAVSGTTPTILYFPRYWRRDCTVEEKLAELTAWRNIMLSPEGAELILQRMLDGLAREARNRGKQLRRVVHIRRPLGRLYRQIKGFWS